MRPPRILWLILWIAGIATALQAGDNEDQRTTPPNTAAQTSGGGTSTTDPFAGVSEAVQLAEAPGRPDAWTRRFFSENLGFRKEIMSQFVTNDGRGASRQSLGFEVLKKFSTSTSTVASFDFQGRLVRRDRFVPVLNDMEGSGRVGWAFEYHNLYLDFYNVFNPLMKDAARSSNVGRFNFRVGRFYVPFGLNLQTDTHGTLLQLSNESNFGFERDWYAGFWGAINKHLNYDAYYLAGSGYDLKFKGQGGLGALRISLANKYSSEYGLEGGVSVLAGSRLASSMHEGGSGSEMVGSDPAPLKTERIGIDARYRHTAPRGLLTFTTELSGGRDALQPVYSQLHEAEYLHGSRRWGVATQFRRFHQEGRGTNSSIIGEFSWYFRNDVGNSNSHWIKLNVERKLQSVAGPPHTVVALQYYFYR
ncbi:MAG TPA: hypothetical protein VN442_15500 [Bryobacteraceae bacterium]|nr:hypothetical protein [Bryobacteraceae bacterium]